MGKPTEEKTDLEIAEEDYHAIAESVDIIDALLGEGPKVLHRTALRCVSRHLYDLMTNGAERLDRARTAKEGDR